VEIGVDMSSLQHANKRLANESSAACDCRRHSVTDQRLTNKQPLPLDMISKCANPQCSKTLMRLDGGRFFGFPGKDKAIENFWLCGICSKQFTLRQIDGSVEVLPRERKMPSRKSA
jgi:hypothetical protein